MYSVEVHACKMWFVCRNICAATRQRLLSLSAGMFSAGGSKYVVLQAMLDACHSSAHVAIPPDVMQKQGLADPPSGDPCACM
jgi:hypothetical protein